VRPVAASSTDGNPLAAPLADSAFLRNPIDIAILIEAIKFARAVAHTPELTAFNPVELVPGADVSSDTDLEAYIRGAAESLFHPSGTCSVGKLESGGVVDTEFRVHGVHGLRVVDASVFPMLPAAHLQSSVYAVAEKVSHVILFYIFYSVLNLC
jgi:choline dehydrogenase-like flavoprotein